jgi:signal transduction histidine kinase
LFKFSFPRAALGLTVFLSLSLGWISFQYYQQQTELVQFFEQEAKGVETAKSLSIELLDFSTYQGFHRERAIQTAKLLIQVSDENLENGADLRREIKNVFENIHANSSEFLSPQEADVVSRLIKSTLRKVIEQSNLILDPSFQTYYFVDALYSQLPDMIYYNYSWQDLINLHTQKNNLAIKGELGVRKAAYERFQESLKKALLVNSQGSKDLSITNYAKIQADVDALSLTTIPLFDAFSQMEKFDRKGFTQSLAQWSEAAKKVIYQGSNAFALLNQTRLQKTQRTLMFSLGLSLLSWIVSLIFIGFIVHSVLEARKLMQRVIHDQRDALARAQKLAVLGEMSAGIGHEIANPLTIIKATTDLLEKNFGADQPELYKHSERIRRMVVRIEDIIRNMKSFLSGDKEEDVHPTPVDLFEVLHEVHDDLQGKLNATQAHFEIEALRGQSLLVMANYGELVQVFTNLVTNAIDAVKDSPQKEIHIRFHYSDAFAAVEVQDSGKGIPSEIKERIFDPLFTTKEAGEGTGLGLSIAQKIISKYHGQLKLLETPSGACFEVTLNREIS